MNGVRQPVVLVGIDGSAPALAAAGWAADEAARRRLPLRLVHAYTVPIMGVPAYGIPPDLSEGLRVAGQAALEAALLEIAKSHPDLQVSAELVNADPRPALVEASAEATLTVVGTRGGGRIPEVLLGSVALHVASHGRSPVAVISLPAAEAGHRDRAARGGRLGHQRGRHRVCLRGGRSSRGRARRRPGLGRPGVARICRFARDRAARGRGRARRAGRATGRLAGQVSRCSRAADHPARQAGRRAAALRCAVPRTPARNWSWSAAGAAVG